jgi:hypothetical protein
MSIHSAYRRLKVAIYIMLLLLSTASASAETEPQETQIPLFLPSIESGSTNVQSSAQSEIGDHGSTFFLPLISSTQGETNPSTTDAPYEYMIIEGDIQVPPDYFDAVASGVDGTFNARLWPNGIVPFEFNGNVSTANQQRMIAAMADWEAVTNVDFRHCASNNCAGAYIHIQNSTVNNSWVGRRGTEQIINIVSWDRHFTLMHELAHALGFWHEQSRADRNTFIRINLGNIMDLEEDNFAVRPNCGFYFCEYGPYDFDSVMHYWECAFAIDCSSGVSITVLAPNEAWQTRIGQRTHLSDMDELTMSLLYPETNWRFVDRANPGSQTGTFLAPYRAVTTGITNTPNAGTLWVQPGTYSGITTLDKPVTIRAPLGGVTLTR